MNKIIVTPAGRKRYLGILSIYVGIAKANSEFDEWHLWMNTQNVDDIAYCQSLAEKHDWVKLIESPAPYRKGVDSSCDRIGSFYSLYPQDHIFLRLDDDIVFIDKGGIGQMFNYREKYPDAFFISGYVINQERARPYNPHALFLGDDQIIVIDKHSYLSINAICYFGKDIDHNRDWRKEEKTMTLTLPEVLNKEKLIVPVQFVHFAFQDQPREAWDRLYLHRYMERALMAQKICMGEAKSEKANED